MVNGSLSIVQSMVDGRIRELECDLAVPNAWNTPECSMETLLPSGPERVTLGETASGVSQSCIMGHYHHQCILVIRCKLASEFSMCGFTARSISDMAWRQNTIDISMPL